MSGQNGIEFLETVREDYPDLPFILYTGKGSETVASEAFSAGATDYLQKESGTEQYTLLANKVTNYVEKYRTEREVRRRAHAMETANEGIAILDESGRYRAVNEAYAEVCGTAPEKILGEHWASTLPDAEADRLRAEAFPELAAQSSWSGEAVGKRPDGSTYTKRLSLAPLDDGGHVCIVRDVTEQKARERELDRAKRKFEKLFVNARDAIVIIDPDTDEYLDCNAAAADLFGISEDRLVAEFSPSDTHPPEVLSALEAFFDDVLERGHGLTDEVPVVTADGERRQVEMSAAYLELDGRPCLVNTLYDRTDRRRCERERRRYERMVNSMREAVCVYDRDGAFDTVNETVAEFYDTTPAALEGEASPFVQRLREEGDGDPYQELLDGDRGELRGDFRGEFPTHGHTLLDYRLTPLTDDGTVEGVVGVARTASDHREREWQLRRYERIVEVSGDPVYTLDADGHFTFVNDRFLEQTGYDRDAVVGTHVSEFMDEDDVETGRQLIRSLLTGDADRDTFEMDLLTASGERLTCETHVALVVSDSEFHGTVGVLRDIAARKRQAAELRRKNDRLERFASLVSHDLRNPLNVAQGRLELAREDVGDCSDLAATADALDRCQRLVDDLLSLAREGDCIDDPVRVSLPTTVRNGWQHVETGDAMLTVDTDATMLACRSRLQQLLENLIRNAVEHGSPSPRSNAPEDAVEHGSTDSSTPVTVTVGNLSDGFYVADDGPGIPEDERSDVFDSGYSSSDEGTGFGLSIVREIAEAHGWSVTVTESDDGGARFEVTDVDRIDSA